MKNINFFALSLLALLLACNKPEPEPQKPAIKGRLNALKNGEVWEAYAHGQISVFDSSKVTLFFSHKDNNSGLTDVMSFNNVSFEVGAHQLIHQPFQGNEADTLIRSLFTIKDYDVALADYILQDHAVNMLHLTHIDPITRHFSGTLDMEFIVMNKADDLGLPDTIRIKNGVFFGEVMR